jgi:hypothetical protein
MEKDPKGGWGCKRSDLKLWDWGWGWVMIKKTLFILDLRNKNIIVRERYEQYNDLFGLLSRNENIISYIWPNGKHLSLHPNPSLRSPIPNPRAAVSLSTYSSSAPQNKFEYYLMSFIGAMC